MGAGAPLCANNACETTIEHTLWSVLHASGRHSASNSGQLATEGASICDDAELDGRNASITCGRRGPGQGLTRNDEAGHAGRPRPRLKATRLT